MKRVLHRIVRPVLLACLLAMLSGCLVIPVDYHPKGSRTNVNAEVRSMLQPGLTTKDEVFMMLGEPDHVSDDGHHLGYQWTRVKYLVAIGYSGGDIRKNYLLVISFDAKGRFSHADVIDTWKRIELPENMHPIRNR